MKFLFWIITVSDNLNRYLSL